MEGKPIKGKSFGADLGGAIKEDLLAMEDDGVPVIAAGANSGGVDGV